MPVPQHIQTISPRVLIIDNAVRRLMFKPSIPWKEHLDGAETTAVNIPSGAAIPPPSEFTHLILTGSEASIVSPEPWFEREAQLIWAAAEAGIRIIGSCFGHQMLVYALSGSEYVQHADPPEVGWAEIEMVESDPLFDGLPNPWRTFVYHFDAVVDPPPPWRKLGRTELCDTHVIRYGDLPIWGIQAHPEISARGAKRFLSLTLLFGRWPARRIIPALWKTPTLDDIVDPLLQRFLGDGATNRP